MHIPTALATLHLSSLLGLTEKNLRKRYLAAAFEWHPDKGDGTDCLHREAMFKKVTDAYETLQVEVAKQPVPQKYSGNPLQLFQDLAGEYLNTYEGLGIRVKVRVKENGVPGPWSDVGVGVVRKGEIVQEDLD